ncbi:mesoderm induction early response protein 1-like isoform X2 [Adelges cooleyi]|uniref:mesoderm induction early response protein 1-like isoform X2 n=1 Tax=Adelges cooleyi TaxID=133065 RepID=UPI00217F3732|nr:mesoderm induction early response protein 1-like isoform X2 [Adelges cooleyi]
MNEMTPETHDESKPTDETGKDISNDKDFIIHADENDDETTMEEEEALPELEDPMREIRFLEEESHMPIDELMLMYGYPSAYSTETNSNDKRSKKRNHSKKNKNKKRRKVPSATADDVSENESMETDNANVKCSSAEDASSKTTTANENKGDASETDANDATESTNNAEECDDETETPSKLLDLYLAELDQVQSEDEDEDYRPYYELHWKSVNVGLNFQAIVTEELTTYGDALPYENSDELLWDPNVLCEDLIEEYLVKVQHITKALKPSSKVVDVRDNEKALYLLVQCGHDTAEAIRRMSLNVVPLEKTLSVWSEEETKKFEKGLELNGKNFHAIQKEVKTRSVAEIVHFYYFWKKSPRYDAFERKQVEMRPELKQWHHWDSDEDQDSDFDNMFHETSHEDSNDSVLSGDKDQMNCLIYADRKRQIEH